MKRISEMSNDDYRRHLYDRLKETIPSWRCIVPVGLGAGIVLFIVIFVLEALVNNTTDLIAVYTWNTVLIASFVVGFVTSLAYKITFPVRIWLNVRLMSWLRKRIIGEDLTGDKI